MNTTKSRVNNTLNPAIVEWSHTDIPSDAGGADIFGDVFGALGLATMAILVL
jgi:hypothetical protein